MNQVTCDITISADGYVGGLNQSADKPFGAVDELHRWMFQTPEESSDEVAALANVGAYITGRNMFGPVRGDWDLDWTGWWGDDPPYHAPVFVLTHHDREIVEKAGGTSFTFVTDGVRSALYQACATAGDGQVAIEGGASTVNQYLAAGCIDEFRLHISPVVLGAGERLFDGVPPLRLEQTSGRSASLVTHVTYAVLR